MATNSTPREREQTADRPVTKEKVRRDNVSKASQKRARKRWSNTHPVNLRLSVPLVFGRYYVTIVAGRERRSTARRARDRRTHPLLTLGNAVFMFAIGSVCGVAALAALELATTLILGQSTKVLVP